MQTAVRPPREPIEQAILDRSIAVIEESGEAGIRTHVIARECGVTAPVLYRLFGNREGLIVAAQAERYARTLVAFPQEIRTELYTRVARCLCREDLVEAITWLFGSLTKAEQEKARLTRLEVIGSAVSRPDLMAAVAATERQAIDELEKVFGAAVSHGWISNRHPARTLITIWHGFILGRYMIEISGDQLDGDAWDTAVLEALLRLMFGDPTEG